MRHEKPNPSIRESLRSPALSKQSLKRRKKNARDSFRSSSIIVLEIGVGIEHRAVVKFSAASRYRRIKAAKGKGFYDCGTTLINVK